jgi:hypothetical protein
VKEMFEIMATSTTFSSAVLLGDASFDSSGVRKEKL